LVPSAPGGGEVGWFSLMPRGLRGPGRPAPAFCVDKKWAKSHQNQWFWTPLLRGLFILRPRHGLSGLNLTAVRSARLLRLF